MDNHWDKNFDRSYLSEERRYGLLTHRYGFKALATINAHEQILDDFQNNRRYFVVVLFTLYPYLQVRI